MIAQRRRLTQGAHANTCPCALLRAHMRKLTHRPHPAVLHCAARSQNPEFRGEDPTGPAIGRNPGYTPQQLINFQVRCLQGACVAMCVRARMSMPAWWAKFCNQIVRLDATPAWVGGAGSGLMFAWISPRDSLQSLAIAPSSPCVLLSVACTQCQWQRWGGAGCLWLGVPLWCACTGACAL